MIPWHICILIPARNEEQLLPRCLYSVLNACEYLPYGCSFDVALVVDSSIDRTFEIGKSIIGSKGTLLSLKSGNVGYVRRVAAQIALGRYKGSLSQCWLANTDADCIVPLTWLSHQLSLAEAGTKAIAGIVKVESFAEHNRFVSERFRKSYILNPDGTHPHVHGANIGIRADAYVSAGGWQALETAEDHALWNRLRELKVPQISDTKLCVITSGRRVGRAPKGFADALAAHNETPI